MGSRQCESRLRTLLSSRGTICILFFIFFIDLVACFPPVDQPVCFVLPSAPLVPLGCPRLSLLQQRVVLLREYTCTKKRCKKLPKQVTLSIPDEQVSGGKRSRGKKGATAEEAESASKRLRLAEESASLESKEEDRSTPAVGKLALCEAWGATWLCEIVGLSVDGATIQLYNRQNGHKTFYPLWTDGKFDYMASEAVRDEKWQYMSTA